MSDESDTNEDTNEPEVKVEDLPDDVGVPVEFGKKKSEGENQDSE